MSLRIRRGTEAQRSSATFDLGEIVYTTDTNKLYVGDGVNLGGKNILATSAGTGLVWNTTTQRLDFNGVGSGIVNVAADANPTLGGNLNLNNRNIDGTGNINITGTITATQFLGTRVSVDINPSLGGNLNLNSRNISGTGNINIIGTITATQYVNLPTPQLEFDPAPRLIGNLNLDSHNITGIGSITITGDLTLTSSTGKIIAGTTAAPAGLTINSATREETFNLRVLSNSSIIFYSSNGTLTAPTPVLNNETPGGFKFKAYNSLGKFNTVGGIFCQYNGVPATDLNNTDSIARGTIAFTTGYGSNQLFASFDSFGVFKAPVFQLAAYADDAARSTAIPTPAAGMMVFMTSGTSPAVTNKAVIYNGTAWALLPG